MQSVFNIAQMEIDVQKLFSLLEFHLLLSSLRACGCSELFFSVILNSLPNLMTQSINSKKKKSSDFLIQTIETRVIQNTYHQEILMFASQQNTYYHIQNIHFFLFFIEEKVKRELNECNEASKRLRKQNLILRLLNPLRNEAKKDRLNMSLSITYVYHQICIIHTHSYYNI